MANASCLSGSSHISDGLRCILSNFWFTYSNMHMVHFGGHMHVHTGLYDCGPILCWAISVRL